MLGSELRKARLAAGLTQEAVAARAKITREYVNKLEHDQYAPTVEVFLRLCAAMNVSAWRMLRKIEERGLK